MNVLIIRFSSMGDVILVAPLLTHLKEHLPDASLHLLTNRLYADLFRSDPRLVSVTPLDVGTQDECLSRLAGVAKWDLVIDLQRNARSRRIRKRFFGSTEARLFDKLHLKRCILLCSRINLYGPDDAVAMRYIRTAGIASHKQIDGVPDVRLFPGAPAEETLRKLWPDGPGDAPVLALAPFSAWRNKQWPAEFYVEVARHFCEKGWRVAVLGGTEDKEIGRRLCNDAGRCCVCLAGEIGLGEVAAVLHLCSLALGNDTGLSHLARACGVLTGIVFGATTAHLGFFPHGQPRSIVFQTDLLCRPCHAHGGNVCLRLSRPCLNRIRPSDVVAGLERLRAASEADGGLQRVRGAAGTGK